MKRDALFWVIIAACLIGLVVSLSSLDNHYSTHSSFCSVSEKINCDTVNRGPYSMILGIPVALLGVAGYLVFGLGALLQKRISRLLSFSGKEVWFYFSIIATIMVLFSLYLTALEMFVIHTYCALCLTSQAMVLILAAGSWRTWYRCP